VRTEHFGSLAVPALIVMLMATPLAAAAPRQARAGAAAATPTPTPYQIFVMEAVLQRAVDHGADILNQQIHRVMPNMIVLAGMSRARGFRLPDYGVFFDVEVPALRKSIAWSFQMLDRPDPSLTGALDELRQHVQTVGDSAMRQSLEEALKEIEAEMGPLGVAPVPEPAANAATSSSHAMTTAAQATSQTTREQVPAPNPEREKLLHDPEGAYRTAVRQALIDAMLDYGGPLALPPDQWLVVAARDDDEAARLPGDPPESHALTLRIRGRDLEAFHAGRLTREQAVARVEVDQD
jgi:hypothetical protein